MSGNSDTFMLFFTKTQTPPPLEIWRSCLYLAAIADRMERGSKCMIFFAYLHFPIRNSLYSNIILKPKQVICLEKLFFGSDVLAVLPLTGCGKS
jgi:hypothetical protein